MTTETTDPLAAIMGAATDAAYWFVRLKGPSDKPAYNKARERLRLHVQLALAKARRAVAESCDTAPGCHDTLIAAQAEIAALEARLQEDDVTADRQS